jgi:hypothetical protein
MSLPFHLQRLSPEALAVLRYMGTRQTPASSDEMETGADLSARSVGRAVRRLVNEGYIDNRGDYTYELTSDGVIAVQTLSEHDAKAGTAPAAANRSTQGSAEDSTPTSAEAVSSAQPAAPSPLKVHRHLSVVMPRSLSPHRATDLYIGVNPPSANDKVLSTPIRLTLRLSAVNGTLSASNITLDVPPDRAANPGKIHLTPTVQGQLVRVRIDAYQDMGNEELEPLGGMYFDAKVATDTMTDATLRAVGMDVVVRG